MDEATTIEDERFLEMQRMARLEEGEQEKLLVGGVAQKVAGKLNVLIEAGHDTAAFLILITLALIKDGPLDWALDFLVIGEIPILGQIPGAIVSATLWLFVRMRSNTLTRFWRKRALLIIIDVFPLLNNLPLTTAGIAWMWYDARKKADEAEADLADLKNKTEEQLKIIDEEIDNI